MIDLEDKIWKILGQPQTAALATISAGGAPLGALRDRPRRRDFTLNFCTSLASRKAGEIAANPAVHLTCGDLRPPDDSASCRSPAAPRSATTRRPSCKYLAGRVDDDISRARKIPITSWFLCGPH